MSCCVVAGEITIVDKILLYTTKMYNIPLHSQLAIGEQVQCLASESATYASQNITFLRPRLTRRRRVVCSRQTTFRPPPSMGQNISSRPIVAVPTLLLNGTIATQAIMYNRSLVQTGTCMSGSNGANPVGFIWTLISHGVRGVRSM